MAALEQALRTDAHRVKSARRSGKALFAQIQAQGYRGGYSAVTDFIRTWRVESAKDPQSVKTGQLQHGRDRTKAPLAHAFKGADKPAWGHRGSNEFPRSLATPQRIAARRARLLPERKALQARLLAKWRSKKRMI